MKTSKAPQHPPPCWQRESNCACLHIILPSGEEHLFPYQHLITASLTKGENVDALHISFSSHDLDIEGHRLRELLLALQELAVKKLLSVPSGYVTIAGQGPAITAIRIAAAV